MASCAHAPFEEHANELYPEPCAWVVRLIVPPWSHATPVRHAKAKKRKSVEPRTATLAMKMLPAIVVSTS